MQENVLEAAGEAAEAGVGPWVGQFARAGYLAIGAVYLVVGVLSEMAAMDVGGAPSGPGGAARTFVAQPYGRVVLGAVTVGLLVFVAWRLAQSLWDVEGRSVKPHGLARRFALLMSGLSYLGLALISAQYVFLGEGRVHDPKTEWTARLMDHPAGQYAAGAVGVAVAGVGLFQLFAAYRAGFTRFVHTDPMHDRAQRIFSAVGRVGLASRGVVFCILGTFTAISALERTPDRAMGVGGVLRLIARQPYGDALLAVVAAGLIAYGAFMLAKVRYRKIAPTVSGDAEEEPTGDRHETNDAP